MAYGIRRDQCRIHKSSPIILILSLINSNIRLTTISLRSIIRVPSYLRLVLPRGLFLVGLPFNILKTRVHSSILATCPAHLHILGIIILTIY